MTTEQFTMLMAGLKLIFTVNCFMCAILLYLAGFLSVSRIIK